MTKSLMLRFIMIIIPKKKNLMVFFSFSHLLYFNLSEMSMLNMVVNVFGLTIAFYLCHTSTCMRESSRALTFKFCL